MVAHPRAETRAPQLRPLNLPRPAGVRTDGNGKLLFVYLNGKRRRVAAVRERWRIDDEWWRDPIAREYTEVVLEDGRPVTLYRDLTVERWFVHE
ncbi:MAG: hypothetical protein HY704_04915 [Gemmatimonadetes bacterium]|nr:hypothetical protein [Gemmatimonadota bacterium]